MVITSLWDVREKRTTDRRVCNLEQMNRITIRNDVNDNNDDYNDDYNSN